jgi:signal peptidase
MSLVDRSRAAFRLIPFVVGVLIVVAGVIMWPARFGGLSTVIIVSGNSMQPTYDTGDVVFAWRDSEPDLGEIIVFEVPEGEAGEGALVVHRLVGFDGSVLVTQGDNNGSQDPWHPTQENVLGSARWRIPLAGRLLYSLGSPLVMAALLGIATVVIVWPRRGDAGAEDESFGDRAREQASSHEMSTREVVVDQRSARSVSGREPFDPAIDIQVVDRSP